MHTKIVRYLRILHEHLVSWNAYIGQLQETIVHSLVTKLGPYVTDFNPYTTRDQ